MGSSWITLIAFIAGLGAAGCSPEFNRADQPPAVPEGVVLHHDAGAEARDAGGKSTRFRMKRASIGGSVDRGPGASSSFKVQGGIPAPRQ